MKHKIIIFISLTTAMITNANAITTWQKADTGVPKIEVVKTTDFGLIAGEKDLRPWLYPYNGVLLSRDMGKSWTQIGLKGTAINDLEFSGGKIYAATHYVTAYQVGIFVTSDQGLTWSKIGPNFTTRQIEVQGETILMGTGSHGLWISYDSGQNWEQKIGDGTGWSGPDINSLEINGNTIVAGIPNHTFISTDLGITWNEINVLSGFSVISSYIHDDQIFLGTEQAQGLFYSRDVGQTWQKYESFPKSRVDYIYEFKNNLYASAYKNQRYTLLRSNISDDNFTDLNFNGLAPLTGITSIFSEPNYIFITSTQDGINYTTETNINLEDEPFLRLPWEYQKDTELTDRITAYFDHEYPLLGYTLFDEPTPANNTLVSFTGERAAAPAKYYTSHNGVDFALAYNSPVLAPASGWAKYYYCVDCGNSIKIDHVNGYQTIFMHLQETDLINYTQEPLWIDKGQMIGRVGMTGKTSGPHIHISVQFDKNGNGIFDDYPDGNVDPFGWQNHMNADPWETFTWQDSSGSHFGTKSKFLWDLKNKSVIKYININDLTVEIENKKIEFKPQEIYNHQFTVFFNNYIRPHIPLEQADLEYVEGTSLSLELGDHYTKDIARLDYGAKLSFDIRALDFTALIPETVKIYFWDVLEEVWKEMETTWDEENQEIYTETEHFSWFAVFGQRINKIFPTTNIEIVGQITNGWFIEYPGIYLTALDGDGSGVAATVYSIDNGITWTNYTEPILIDRNGIFTLLYKSINNNGLIEPNNELNIKINTDNSISKKIRVRESNFIVP